MPRRLFEVVDVSEILIHWYAGRPKADVARSLGVDRKTVRKYVEAAEAAGFSPGGPPVAAGEWAAAVRRWFPELVAPELRSPTFAELGRHHEAIKAGMATNTLATVHQRLHDERGLGASLASLRRYVRVTLPEEAARERVTVRRDDPPPGEEAQIDYGYLGTWTDARADRRHRVWAFLMVLASSRHLFLCPVLRMTLAAWVEAHVQAFHFFGGVPRRLVVDNLKAGVLKADLYDPKLNRTYAELAAHYGTLVDPARARHPKDKPRVERIVPYARDSFFAGREFASFAAMRGGAAVWSREVAGRRSCRPLGGAAPLAVFEATEREALLALPGRDYEMAVWSTPTVAQDTHVVVEGALYSVPWRYIGREIDVRASRTEIACYLEGELVKTHPRRQKGRATDWADYPPEKVAFFQRTPAWCRHRAAELGPAVTAVIAELLAGQALHHLRQAQGILGLVERHTPERLDAACRRALEAGDPGYRTIKGILVAGRERASDDEQRVPDAPAFLHGPTTLFEEVPR